MTVEQSPHPSTAPLQLHYTKEGQSIVVTPNDESRFVLSVTEAINACKVYDKIGMVNFRTQFEALLSQLASWIDTHISKISKAYVTTRDSGLLFLVATKEPSFDQELEDALTDLDMSIANDEDLSLIRLSVLAIPSDSEDAVNCFADQSTLMVYAK